MFDYIIKPLLMKYSNERPSVDQQSSYQNEATKRLSSHPSQSRFQNYKISMSTTRSLVNVACAYHNDQKITNFCQNKECLLPLCPKCIGIHCQQHSNAGIYGHFESIDDCSIRVQESLKDYLHRLQVLGRLLSQGKSNLQAKNKKIKESIAQVKRIFQQNMKRILSNFEKAVSNIWSIQQNIMMEQLKESQEYSNNLCQNYNACLKKIMNPAEKLQGIINYFHNQESFQGVDQAIQNVRAIVSRSDLTIQISDREERASQDAFRQSVIITNLQNEIWSEFKLLSIRQRRQADLKKLENHHIQEKIYVNLENFVSPLEQFCLMKFRRTRERS